MTDGKIPRLAALVREAFAVLAAILIAFALDAWWDRQKERGDMLEALDAVVAEVDRNLALMDSALIRNRRASELVYEALQLTPEDVAEMAPGELGRFAGLPAHDLVTLQMGAATAFIEGGFLSVLEDQTLRARIAGLPRMQAELDEEARVVNEASAAFNASMVPVAPDEFVISGALGQPPGGEVVVGMLLSSEQMARTLSTRTFFLVFLYGEEIRNIRGQLEDLAERLEAYRAG